MYIYVRESCLLKHSKTNAILFINKTKLYRICVLHFVIFV